MLFGGLLFIRVMFATNNWLNAQGLTENDIERLNETMWFITLEMRGSHTNAYLSIEVKGSIRTSRSIRLQILHYFNETRKDNESHIVQANFSTDLIGFPEKVMVELKTKHANNDLYLTKMTLLNRYTLSEHTVTCNCMILSVLRKELHLTSQCPMGYYHPQSNCSAPCRCRLPSQCHMYSGLCMNGGCMKGWQHGKDFVCKRVCAAGTYLINSRCSGRCRCRHEGRCRVTEGLCVSGGCLDGWHGLDCQTRKTYDGVNDEWGSSSIVLCLLVFMAIMSCASLTKRRASSRRFAGRIITGNTKTTRVTNQKTRSELQDPRESEIAYGQSYSQYPPLSADSYVKYEGSRFNTSPDDIEFNSTYSSDFTIHSDDDTEVVLDKRRRSSVTSYPCSRSEMTLKMSRSEKESNSAKSDKKRGSKYRSRSQRNKRSSQRRKSGSQHRKSGSQHRKSTSSQRKSMSQSRRSSKKKKHKDNYPSEHQNKKRRSFKENKNSFRIKQV